MLMEDDTGSGIELYQRNYIKQIHEISMELYYAT